MSFSNYEFPNTNFYDSDLRELIDMYKKLVKEYDAIKEEIDKVIGEYGSIMSDVQELKQRMSDIESQFAGLEEKITKSIMATVNAELSATVKKLEDDNEALRMDVAQYVSQINAQMLALQNNVNQQIENLGVEVKASLTMAKNYTDGEVGKLKLYVDGQDNKIIDMIQNIKVDQSEVVDPVDEKQKPIQEALFSMYYNLKAWALRAIDYDAVGITAEEYDGLSITAWAYDYLGKWYVREKRNILKKFENFYKYVDSRTTAYSPISGLVVGLRDLVYEVCAVVRTMCLQANEYDALGLTAEEYEQKDLTAYIYDWYAKLYLSTASYSITAQEYDETQTTALLYDMLGMTALVYDRSARLVLIGGQLS